MLKSHIELYPVLRSLLFRLDPELAHGISLRLIRLAGSITPFSNWLRQIYCCPTSTGGGLWVELSEPDRFGRGLR